MSRILGSEYLVDAAEPRRELRGPVQLEDFSEMSHPVTLSLSDAQVKGQLSEPQSNGEVRIGQGGETVGLGKERTAHPSSATSCRSIGLDSICDLSRKLRS